MMGCRKHSKYTGVTGDCPACAEEEVRSTTPTEATSLAQQMEQLADDSQREIIQQKMKEAAATGKFSVSVWVDRNGTKIEQIVDWLKSEGLSASYSREVGCIRISWEKP